MFGALASHGTAQGWDSTLTVPLSIQVSAKTDLAIFFSGEEPCDGLASHLEGY